MNEEVVPRPAGRQRVSIYASDPVTAAGLSALLTGRAHLTVLPRQRDMEADVFVVATDTVDAEFLDTLSQLLARANAPFVVIIRDRWTADLFAAIELGVGAVLRMDGITADRLAEAVTTVSHGGASLPADLQSRLVEQIRQVQRDILRPRGINAHGLVNREVDVLRLLANGSSINEIAEKLSYSERTVKNILHALTSRLGLRNRTQAVAYAMRIGAI